MPTRSGGAAGHPQAVLILSDVAGQGVQLKKRRDERKRKETIGAFSNVLAFRFKGFDPERVLNAIYPYVSWFFSGAATIGSMILASLALLLVIVQFDVFQSRLPSFQSFFAAQNWLLIAGVLGVTKVIHEFGHGFGVCGHHKIGVLSAHPFHKVIDLQKDFRLFPALSDEARKHLQGGVSQTG